LFVAHSFTSLQTRAVPVCPLLVKPDLQAQVKLPVVFVHVAFGSHPPLFVAHSFTSVHVTPSPE
jgi:hypothetical protein